MDATSRRVVLGRLDSSPFRPGEPVTFCRRQKSYTARTVLGGLAQLVERDNGIVEARGSSPLSSTGKIGVFFGSNRKESSGAAST